MKARKIELKMLEVEGQPVSYGDLLTTVITASGQGGMSTDDVLKAVDIKADLKAANGALNMSEPDYNWMLAKLNGTIRWAIANDQLAEFIRDVRAAPVVEL